MLYSLLQCFTKSLPLNNIQTSRVTPLLCDSCAPLDDELCHSCEINSASLVQEVLASPAAVEAERAVLKDFPVPVPVTSATATCPTLPHSLIGCIHRVFLGLLPDSSRSWQNAIKLLHQKLGGYLHIHGVAPLDFVPVEFSWQSVVVQPNGEALPTVHHAEEGASHKLLRLRFGQDVLKEIVPFAAKKAAATYHCWRASISHIEKVKSYSPKKYHFVVDLHLHPLIR